MEKAAHAERHLSFFEKNLTLWVILCMGAGVLIGKFLPAIPNVLARFEYAKVSIPIAVLIWFMIYPMMMKVDFTSIKNVRKTPEDFMLPGQLTGLSSLLPCSV